MQYQVDPTDQTPKKWSPLGLLFRNFGSPKFLGTLHIVIVLNVFQLWATLPGHEGSFKDHKNAFFGNLTTKMYF